MVSLQPILFAIALLILGLGLLVLEIFIVSFGLLSMLAMAALAASIWFAFQAGDAIGWLFVVLAPLTAIAVARYGLKRIQRSSVIPREEVTADAGYHHTAERLNVKIGSVGKLVTPARPTGRAKFELGECDVSAQGQALEAGDSIVVTHIEGPTISVNKQTAFT